MRRYGWSGDYPTWEAAKAASSGYDSSLIINKVLEATLKVKEGKYPYERDSVLFDHIEYEWPLLAALMWVAAQNKGELNVLDFGGSLGSTYWQNRKFLESLSGLKWNIIEQSQYVEAGKKNLENDVLQFYPDIESCLASNTPNLILISSVLNYLKNPFSMLSSLANLNIGYMILERVPFINHGRNLLTVQRVPPKIYEASYPAWFFDRQKFFNFIEVTHNVLEVYDCNMKLSFPSQLQGLILTLKKPAQ
jgi:putative methyltransferase (TIGR04325 family)